jgi:hypothetical protein
MLPPLGEATSFEQKCDILRKTLFPMTEIDVSNLDLSNLASYVDLTDVFSLVTPDEVSRTLRKCDINTACDHDRIGYSTIIQLNTVVPDLLPYLITAVLREGVHHPGRKKALCIVTPKPGEKNYSSSSAYCPISLLPCLAKLVEHIAADRLMNSAITCRAMSRDQFGGRPEHSAVDALIKSFGPVTDTLGPKNGRTSRFIPRPSMATHDIKGAFNNTHPEALRQIMTTRRMPKYLINWVIAFTKNRELVFSFDGNQESGKPFTGAIPQGSPVSPTLFSIVMSAIINMPNHMPLVKTTAYVDDVNDTSASPNPGTSVQALEQSFKQKLVEAQKPGMSFDPEKSEVIHFSIRARQKKSEMDMHLDINGQSVIVESKPQIRYLESQ